jgi:hypothetical protein
MPTARLKKVPARDMDVYRALADSWRAACVDRTADPAGGVSNWSYVSERGRWLVTFGPTAPAAPLVYDDTDHEYTSAELRDRLGLAAPKAPTKPQVLAAARRLYELAATEAIEVPDHIADILYHDTKRPGPVEVPEVDDVGAVAPRPVDEADELLAWLSDGAVA